MTKRLENKSKQLVKALRHKPELYNINLDSNGYARIEDVIKEFNITVIELQEIVETNDKKRFEFDIDEELIRATQGHSIKVDIDSMVKLSKNELEHMYLYHGTSISNLDSILETGISKMSREYVHLSTDIKTAKIVGARHKKDNVIVLEINTDKLVSNIDVYKSSNRVYLCKHVSPVCFSNIYKYDMDGNEIYPKFNTNDNIISNKILTPDGTILQSNHVHDYVDYTDKNGKYYSVDGGTEYLKRTGELFDYIDLSITETSPYFVIREHLKWGTRGKNGDQPLMFKKLSKMTEEHILNILLTQHQISKKIKKYLIKELKYRLEHNIVIKD